MQLLFKRATLYMSYKNKLIQLFSKPFFALIAIATLLSSTYFITPLLAAPFAPGETLDPNCLPGSNNCKIVEPWTSTATSSDIVFNQLGSVGVGTTTPTNKLTVVGDTYISDILSVASTTGTSTISGNLTIGNSLCINGDCRSVWPAVGSSLWATTSGSRIFYNAGVLIATTTDDLSGANLQVNGGLSLNGNLFDSNKSAGVTGYILQTTATGTQWVATTSLSLSSNWTSSSSNIYYTLGNVSVGTATSSTNKLNVWGNLNIATGTTPALYVNTALSNVGIGTSTPTKSLTVAGNQYLTGAFYDSTNASGTAGMVLQSTGTSTRWATTGSSQWISSSSNIYFNSGKVSIGTTNTIDTLSVVGTSSFFGSILNKVSSLSDPKIIGTLSGFGINSTVAVSGNYLYLGSAGTDYSSTQGVYVVDTTNPYSPRLISNLPLVNSNISDMTIFGHYI
ncbi:MAG: hypothetical protein WCJ59_00010 [bacterium]